MSKMPAKTREKYLRLRRNGIRQGAAADECKISRSSAHRLDMMLEGTGTHSLKQAMSLESNPPKAWDDLTPLAQDCLRDFGLFCQTFFVRDTPPWRSDAARKILDLVQDPDQTYGVFNAPSGAGKSTLMMDVILWLISGGGTCDPAFGRSLRFMYGHGVFEKAVHSVELLRRTLESPKPFYNQKTRETAPHSLLEVFGRYKPSPSDGDLDVMWQQSQFVVAGMSDAPVWNKEPTVQAISYGATFLNERADVIILDDVVTPKNVGDPEALGWLETSPESRMEPAGTLLLVGQRLAGDDLYGQVLDRTWTPDEDEDPVPAYQHVVYRAHDDDVCDGSHRQADLEGNGCLLDARRLPWRKLAREQAKGTYAAMYQQSPESSSDLGIIDPAWINGTVDSSGLEAIGNLDRDRAFWEPVAKLDKTPLITYLTIDPAEGGRQPNSSWWALEVWQVDPTNRVRFLLYGTRGRWTISEILSYDESVSVLGGPATGRSESGGFSGVLEDIVFKAASVGARLSAMVIEQNAARTFLDQRDFDLWRRNRWPDLKVIPFQTGSNRNDPITGVVPLLQDAYRNGTARWPYKTHRSVDALNYLGTKMAELTHVRPKSNDTVMAEWVGAASLDDIIVAGARQVTRPTMPDLPRYLKNRQREIPIDRDGRDEVTDWAREHKAEQLPADHPARQRETFIPGLS
jgi:hypothetical protein